MTELNSMLIISQRSCESITKQEDKTYDEDRNRSITTNPDLTQMLELGDKDI